MAAYTFTNICQRYQDLVGDPDGTINDFGKRNINYAIQDIINRYQFSWNKKPGTVTLTAGAGSLPTDLNPRWGLADARIVNSSDGDDNIFTEIPYWNKDKFNSDSYVYWILPDSTDPDTNTFNSKTLTGSVTVGYFWKPADLSAGTDKCIIPDIEAVALLAASKNWIGSERDQGLEEIYRKRAEDLINAMYFRDLQSHEPIYISSVVSLNADLAGGVNDTDWLTGNV